MPSLAAAAVVAAAFLFARVKADRSGLRVFAAGFVRVMDVPAAAIAAATPRTSAPPTTAAGATGTTAAPPRCWSAAAPPSSSRKTDGHKLAVSGGSPGDRRARLAEVADRASRRGPPDSGGGARVRGPER